MNYDEMSYKGTKKKAFGKKKDVFVPKKEKKQDLSLASV